MKRALRLGIDQENLSNNLFPFQWNLIDKIGIIDRQNMLVQQSLVFQTTSTATGSFTLKKETAAVRSLSSFKFEYFQSKQETSNSSKYK